MSDIDFDELDRAVSKYVGSSSSSDDKPTTSTPPASDTAPTFETSIPVVPTNSDATGPSSTTSLPKRRSSGRFMDVVHPSSDMGTSKVSGEPEKNTSSNADIKRTAPTLEPLDTPVISEENQSTTQDKEETHATDKVEEDSTHEWPDPITVGSSSPKEETQPTPVEEPPLFLPNAKVEKRPLGGVPKDTLDATLPSEDSETKEDMLESQGENKADVPEPDLPPELEKDLVAIEAGEAPEIPREEAEESMSPPETIQDEKLLSVSEKKDEPTPEPPRELLATGSIPQQYKTPPIKREMEATEPDHPAFLNADHYEKAPATTPAKPKSKAAAIFQWVFIILGLLFLGGTLGAAFFVFVNR